MRMLVYKDSQRLKQVVQNVVTHSFDVPVRNTKPMKVNYARGDLGKLRVVKGNKREVSQNICDVSHQTQTIDLWI